VCLRRHPAVAYLRLIRPMRVLFVVISLLSAAVPCWVCAQGTVVSDDRLPPASVELKRNDPPATSTPWQLPKPGDPLYDAEKEAQIKKKAQPRPKKPLTLWYAFLSAACLKAMKPSSGEILQTRWIPRSRRIPSCRQTPSSFHPHSTGTNRTTFRHARRDALGTFQTTTLP
jgi:hypothetical protein